VQTLLEVFDDAAAFAPFRALVRGAVSNEHAATLLGEFLSREVVGRLAAFASPGRPELRASSPGRRSSAWRWPATSSPSPLATTDRETVVACVGPTIQRYLTGALLATG
jgi:hypothetical protein